MTSSPPFCTLQMLTCPHPMQGNTQPAWSKTTVSRFLSDAQVLVHEQLVDGTERVDRDEGIRHQPCFALASIHGTGGSSWRNGQ